VSRRGACVARRNMVALTGTGRCDVVAGTASILTVEKVYLRAYRLLSCHSSWGRPSDVCGVRGVCARADAIFPTRPHAYSIATAIMSSVAHAGSFLAMLCSIRVAEAFDTYKAGIWAGAAVGVTAMLCNGALLSFERDFEYDAVKRRKHQRRQLAIVHASDACGEAGGEGEAAASASTTQTTSSGLHGVLSWPLFSSAVRSFGINFWLLNIVITAYYASMIVFLGFARDLLEVRVVTLRCCRSLDNIPMRIASGLAHLPCQQGV
jgi:hypothetical protein